MVIPIVAALFICYFLAHSFQGNRSVLAWMHLHKQVTLAEQTLAETRSMQDVYERRIALLRSEQLDADMLDERARIMAGLVHPDDFIVLDPMTVQSR